MEKLSLVISECASPILRSQLDCGLQEVTKGLGRVSLKFSLLARRRPSDGAMDKPVTAYGGRVAGTP